MAVPPLARCNKSARWAWLRTSRTARATSWVSGSRSARADAVGAGCSIVIDLEPAVQRAIAVITSVADDELGLPTPCPDACVGDLVDHIGVFAVRFTAVALKQSDGETPAPPPPSGTNLEPGWRQRISRNLAALAGAWRDPAAWRGTSFAGGIEMPGAVAGLVALDELLVHGWDIAVAT